MPIDAPPIDQSAPRNDNAIDRIWMIEGARAWLAWAVVFAHVAQITGLVYTLPGWHIFQIAAGEAVHMFIIISGFVITGLVLTRREPWTAYITRRAFRIFPAYLVTLAFAAFAIFLGLKAIDYMGWANDPTFRFPVNYKANIDSVLAAPWAHALANLTLMQGVVPEEIVPRMQTAVLGPAWSLSLEWQFYLIAPALIGLLINPKSRVITIVVMIALLGLHRLGAFGSFTLPSFLPGAIHWFLIGIASRLALPLLLQHTPPAALAIGFVGLAAAFQQAVSVFLWAALLTCIIGAARWHGGLDGAARRAVSALLESPVARALGARSYSVYIVHYPIMLALAYGLLPLHPFSQFEALAVLGAATIVATLIVSDLMYRFIEKPMIRVGARLASARGPSGEKLDKQLQAQTP
jgi:peptidoglycan/LPS O-acetylase OafA/YrhL